MQKKLRLPARRRWEPGVFIEIELLIKEKGLILPSYTASKTMNALGGMIGNNSAGELTLRYGQTADCENLFQLFLSDGLIKDLTDKPSRSEVESIRP